MKPKLSHFQVLNQENIQERSNQRQSSIPYHQPTPPPPQAQQAAIASRTSSSASNDINQQDEAILIPNTFLLLMNPPGSPTLTLDHLPSQSVLPNHATPRIYPHPEDHESSTDSPPRTALPTARFSSTSLPVRMPLPTGNVPSLLPLQRPYCPYPTFFGSAIYSERPPLIRPLSPRAQLLMLLQPPPPHNETNHQYHEATLNPNTFLSLNSQTMPLAYPSSCPTNTLHQPSQMYPHSQEMYQERSTALLPRTTLPTPRFSSMPLPTGNVPPLLPLQRPYPRPPVIRPLSPRPQLATRQQLLLLLQSPPPPPSTPDAGSFLAANQNQPNENDREPIIAPYTWATTRRATVHPFGHLRSRGINTIYGWVQCKYCDNKYVMQYNLKEKFMEVASIIIENKNSMHGMAPSFWLRPTLLHCNCCDEENRVMPIVHRKKRNINWLFLLLGQWIGRCSPRHLRYFCKHNGYRQEGSKAQLIYRTYIGLSQQLLPEAHFGSLITALSAP